MKFKLGYFWHTSAKASDCILRFFCDQTHIHDVINLLTHHCSDDIASEYQVFSPELDSRDRSCHHYRRTKSTHQTTILYSDYFFEFAKIS